ncbi:muts domain V-domain-containing protein [Dichomitus squalens]|uniref:DNA mismatch repair protein MSH3 n=1 Tax=Dichomitus squalens TaxID=114155 RepID=A0A4Q9MPX8_9APHY|nr:muts domain V-domain-containing protein [Dichomitus squalens]
MSKKRLISSQAAQPTISSFFSQSSSSASSRGTKRGSTPIDLTLDSDDGGKSPPHKRQKTTSAFFTPRKNVPPSPKSATQPPRSGGHAEQWRFDPASPSKVLQPVEGEKQRRAHERAKKILLGSDNVLAHRSSSGAATPAPDGDGPPEHDEERSADEGDEAEKKFGELMEMFSSSNSKARKGKGAAKKAAPVAGPSRSRTQKVDEIGPSGQAYTPFELQVRELKAKHPGTVLMIQSGYKMLFFEEDAKIASKELGMVCFPKRNLLTAMIPLHRRDVHLKKLLSQGYKVGIVQQTETAALKKIGDSRNELFAREVTHLYTAATYVDDLNTVDELDPNSAPPLMCILEEPRGGMGTDERVNVAMVAISPSTGDVVWDEFEDNHMRIELETRLVHTKPYELLLPMKDLSSATEKMIKHFTEHSHTEHRMRIERFKKQLAFTDAFAALSKFYTEKHANASESFNKGDLMAAVTGFPKLVVAALAQSLKYLITFNVADALRETRFFAKFTERTHMLLNANTLTNLEIYRNDTDYSTKGSLMWMLDRTSTKFGARMLRSWVGRPLVDPHALRERTEAVEEILANKSPKLTQLRELLRRLPDLARGLCRIQYGKCTPQELVTLLKAFKKAGTAFFAPHPSQASQGSQLKSRLLADVLEALPKLRDPVNELCEAVRFEAASEGNEHSMWTNRDRFPALEELNTSIQIVETELMDELKNIRKVVQKPALKYTDWNGEEYVVEIRKDERRDIPANWTLLSSTKYLRRYHTPQVRAKLQERAQFKEALVLEAHRAYLSFLAEIVDKDYALLRDAVNKLAVADCLFSLAQVAAQEGYCRPKLVERKEGEEDVLEIVQGRHPMIEALRAEPFVPNGLKMGGGETRHKIITGPNMGGKSSAVRMTALCAIMAQVGSYVPAESMTLSLLDGVLTRMGASDELARGRSTFMVEMQETSDIIQTATPRTLVVLDELGRGTSTFDGMAIASAVLHHLAQNVKCKTLFITHYPQVAADLERLFPAEVGNVHMGFTEETRIDGSREVTFLYRLESGLVTESFGIECARLARLPESVLKIAAGKALHMRQMIEERVRRTK